ncbi:hypothetical protein BJV82DRAFT_612363 [Fennellomyces sp. T-0311]|nr:hypothetical protein BJV82DRAFT_612363 [Fennellomyces sp. T-0311]
MTMMRQCVSTYAMFAFPLCGYVIHGVALIKVTHWIVSLVGLLISNSLSAIRMFDELVSPRLDVMYVILGAISTVVVFDESALSKSHG